MTGPFAPSHYEGVVEVAEHSNIQIGLKGLLAWIGIVSLLLAFAAYLHREYFRDPPIVVALITDGNVVEWGDKTCSDSMWLQNRNRDIYILRILSMTKIDALEYSAKELSSIDQVSLNDDSRSTKRLNFLSEMPTLRLLFLDVPSLDDLSFLNDLPDLESLSLSCPIRDLRPFRELGSLRSLALRDLRDVDLSILSKMDRLVSISIRGTFTNIGALADCEVLQLLVIESDDFDMLKEVHVPQDVKDLASVRPRLAIVYNNLRL